jgi:hypothetical protein
VFGLNFVEAAVDATRQAAQWLLCEPPFFSSRLRWIDSRTSSKAAAIRNPGGWSGPPGSLLRMPRTAAPESSTTAPAGSASGGEPQRHRLVQRFGPLLGLGDQPPHFVGRRGDQRLGEPHAFLRQLPDHVEGLVTLLGLKTVDREDELIDGFVLPPQGRGVFLPRGEQDLVMPDLPGQGVRRQFDARAVEQLRLDLGDRPVPRTAAMTDPAQDIPANGPLGQSDGDLELGAGGRGVAGAVRIGTVVELADQFHRPLQRMEVAVAVITDIHHAPTNRAIAIEDIEFPQGYRPDCCKIML